MSYGKFNSAEELLKSYQNLQAAFTRRCQYIKLLRERAQDAGLDIPPLAKEGEIQGDILQKDMQLPTEQELNTANRQSKEGNVTKEGAPNGGEKADSEEKITSAIKSAKGVSAQEVLNEVSNTEGQKKGAEQTQNFEEKEQGKVLTDGLRQKKDTEQKAARAHAIENSLKNGHFENAEKEQEKKAIEDSLNISLIEVFDGKDIAQEKSEVLPDRELSEQNCGGAEQENALNNSLSGNPLKEERAHGQKVFTQEGGISAQSPPPTEEEFYAKYPFAKMLKLKTYLGEGTSLCVVTPFEKALLAALGDAQSLYQAMAHDEQYLESLLDTNRKLYEKALNRYAAACARSTPPVIGKGSAYPSVPPQKPKTLEEARGLIKHYIK